MIEDLNLDQEASFGSASQSSQLSEDIPFHEKIYYTLKYVCEWLNVAVQIDKNKEILKQDSSINLNSSMRSQVSEELQTPTESPRVHFLQDKNFKRSNRSIFSNMSSGGKKKGNVLSVGGTQSKKPANVHR